MTTQYRNRLRFLAAVTLLGAGTAACADGSSATGLGTPRLAVATDTIPGTGSLSELQQRRATWVARGIDDYRVELSISCFCGSDIIRPVLVEVRRGVVVKVWDLETAKPVTTLTPYPTITGLFDRAIAERSRGGFVSVTYSGGLGLPVRLEVGTLANDAGVLYLLGSLTRL